jgi:hypothetical protein
MPKKNYEWLMLAAVLAFWVGCSQKPSDDFQSKAPKPAPMKADSEVVAVPKVVIDIPAGQQFGFSLVLNGPARLDFYDETDRHTGPATKDEYLPMLESILSQPGLHEEEKANLESQKERIMLTGSAAEFYINRGIPNLQFKSGADKKEAGFKGGDEIMLKIYTAEAVHLELNLKVWNHRQAKQAQYSFDAGPEQSGEINISSTMEDFTLEWDENGDDKAERSLQPVKLDSMVIVPPAPVTSTKSAAPSAPAAQTAPPAAAPATNVPAASPATPAKTGN